MMISIIAEDYGEDFAIAVSDMCLNGPDVAIRSEQRSSIAKAISSRNPRILAVLRAMYDSIEDPLTLDELATSAGISRRQIERQFRQLLNEAPAQTYRQGSIRTTYSHGTTKNDTARHPMGTEGGSRL